MADFVGSLGLLQRMILEFTTFFFRFFFSFLFEKTGVFIGWNVGSWGEHWTSCWVGESGVTKLTTRVGLVELTLSVRSGPISGAEAVSVRRGVRSPRWIGRSGRPGVSRCCGDV